jgi:hypothetical protein
MKRPLLERLREKPKEVRVQASFLGALCVTGIVGLLWGVTLPARLQGVAGSGEATGDGSLYADAKNNLSQIIGAVEQPEAQTEEAPTSASGAYREGAPPAETPGYNDSPFAPEQPPVMPIDRREVLIATSSTR